MSGAIKAALCPTSTVEDASCYWIRSEAVRVHSVHGPRSVSHAVAIFDGNELRDGPAIEALLDHTALEVRVRFEFDTCNSLYERTQFLIKVVSGVDINKYNTSCEGSHSSPPNGALTMCCSASRL